MFGGAFQEILNEVSENDISIECLSVFIAVKVAQSMQY